MAIGMSCQIHVVSYLPPTTSPQPNMSFQIKPRPKRKPICPQFIKSTTPTISRTKGFQFFIKATEEKDLQSINSNNESESQSAIKFNQQEPSNEPQSTTTNIDELGSEINKAMKERDHKDGDFWGGVAEEIREIEWPAFGKVLGTTGVVLGVIAGSSVVLLTVNAVLAEFSDQLFAGRGFRISSAE